MGSKIYKKKVIAGTPNLIGYLRLSKERNKTGSHSFPTQRAGIIADADRRYGMGRYNIKFFEDDGQSGTKGMTPTGLRPKVRVTLQRIVDQIISGDCDAIIIFLQSRFFRNQRGLRELVEDTMLPYGTPLHCHGKEIDIFNEASRMRLYADGLDDEKYSVDLSQRICEANDSRAQEGYPLGQVGYGWVSGHRVSDDEHERPGIAPAEDQKPSVIYIKDRYLAGANTVKIAGELNEQGVDSPLKSKKWKDKAENQRARTGHEPMWTCGAVWTVLKSPVHSGQVALRDGELIQGRHWEHRYWEPEVHQQILQAHKERNARFKTGTGRKNAPHLLNGIIHCGRCGRRLYMDSTSASTIEHRAYVCSTGEKAGKRTCPEVRVRAQMAEDAVVNTIAELAQEPVMQRLMEKEVALAAGKQDAKLSAERIQLKGIITKSEEQFERWADSYSSGDRESLTLDEFNQFNRTLRAKREKAADRLEEVENVLANRAGHELWLGQLKQTLGDFPLIWAQLDNDEKKQVLDLLLEDSKVIADRDGGYLLLQFKVHFLPLTQLRLLRSTMRGISQTKATGMQRLTARQMLLLYYAGQGKTRKEYAGLMGVHKSTVYSIEETIRKNLGVASMLEAFEMAKEKIEPNLALLLSNQTVRRPEGGSANVAAPALFVSPVLMEVFELFAVGATVTEAADRLNLSPTTVQGRRARILKLFNTNSMFKAVAQAKEQGLL